MSRFKPTSSLKPSSWNGFRSCRIGLEMQQPWAASVLEGLKSIETRSYPLPSALIHRKIDILESKKGEDGVSALRGHRFDATDLKQKICRKGWIIIGECIEYRQRTAFEKDVHKHLVTTNSGYAWKEGKTKVIYGWKVTDYGLYDETHASTKYRIIRRMRSLFEIEENIYQNECRQMIMMWIALLISVKLKIDPKWIHFCCSRWAMSRILFHWLTWIDMDA
eukprot:942070_1